MSKVLQENMLFKITFLIMLIAQIHSLSASEISQKCHCDITTSFCDFGCCCDTDCGSSISQSCFYSKSSFYCPKTQFFKSIKTMPAATNFCYYFNSTTTITAQKSLTSSQKSQLISKNIQISPVMSSLSSGYKGYKVSNTLTIGGKSTFSFASNTGNCLSAAGSALLSFKFGLNTKISCICNGCGTPLLFSEIMGKKVQKYSGISSNDLTLPSVSDSSMTSLKINLIIGTYGSQKIKFLDRVTYSYQSNGSNVRSLYINFIDSDNIKEQQTSASFFPQIPADMFYPIHIMS